MWKWPVAPGSWSSYVEGLVPWLMGSRHGRDAFVPSVDVHGPQSLSALDYPVMHEPSFQNRQFFFPSCIHRCGALRLRLVSWRGDGWEFRLARAQIGGSSPRTYNLAVNNVKSRALASPSWIISEGCSCTMK